MIHIVNKIKMSACSSGLTLGLTAMALGLTSCNDFLDITPLNEIVLENYWTEKSDVESVLYSCYGGMEASDFMQRLFVWGEVRSDNVTTSSSTNYQLQQIISENILETNNWIKWQSFYQVINRCNTVIYYAPKVADIDPNYTENEMKANVAEATFLRTLCYFYLARTFRDVPYSTQPSKDDNDVEGDYRLAATPMSELLPLLISDLEAVKGDALRLYPEESGSLGTAANTSRVTTCAIQALLADLYLWNQQYDKCIECCDNVLAYKLERYEELKDEEPEEAQQLELFKDKYPLYLEQPSGNTMGAVYNQIFGTGNSFESIFELYFQNNQSQQNTLVSTFYGNASTSIGQCTAYSGLYADVYEKNNKVFAATDCRVAEGIQAMNTQYAIRKYAFNSLAFTVNQSSGKYEPSFSSRPLRSTNYANWIFYRLTDVMLMKAEAEVELQTAAAQDDAFSLVSVVYNRANNFTTASTDTLVRGDYATTQQMRELVLDERRRELMFEGKRWYDLVRFSLRMGDNTYMVNTVKEKQKDRQTAIALQLSDQNALFWPYHEDELDANPKLTQNSAYITNETSQK